jgi:hypothetical protein
MGIIVINDIQASFKKTSTNNVDKKRSPINVDKEQINKTNQEPILRYPFVAGVAIEDEGKGLFLGEDPINLSPDFLLTLQIKKTAPRNHVVYILQQDLDCLQPGQYLNDCVVVDFLDDVDN